MAGVLRIVGRGGPQSPLVQRMHRQLPRPEQVQLIDALPQAQLLEYLRSSLALLSASTEEGFDYPVLEAKAEGTPTLISDIPVHREFHQDSSLFFPVDDDGGALADHVIACLQDRGLWTQLSQGGYALAKRLSVAAQVASIEDQFRQLCRTI